MTVPLTYNQRTAQKILAAMVFDNCHPTTVDSLSVRLGLKYHTVRHSILWLKEHGYIKQDHKERNLTFYVPTIEDVAQLERLIGTTLHEVLIDNPEVGNVSKIELGEQPLEAWLAGYASQGGRTNNAKKMVDNIPFVIAELFNIAVKTKIEKPWLIQERLNDLRKVVNSVIETFERLLKIANELERNPLMWDARSIGRITTRGDIEINTDELITMISEIRRHYGVPDASYES